MQFCSKFIKVVYMYINNYSNVARFDKVIAKIKWCSHRTSRFLWKVASVDNNFIKYTILTCKSACSSVFS